MNCQVNYNFDLISSKNHNETLHRLNGNVTGKGSISIFHLNKGNSNFLTKIDDLLFIIDKYKPDIFSIQEANFDIKENIFIPRYKIEVNTLVKDYNIA